MRARSGVKVIHRALGGGGGGHHHPGVIIASQNNRWTTRGAHFASSFPSSPRPPIIAYRCLSTGGSSTEEEEENPKNNRPEIMTSTKSSSGRDELSNNNNNNKPPHLHLPRRAWLDSTLPLEVRVSKFVQRDLGNLDPNAAFFDSVELADRCCRLQDFVGMKWAHDILDRVLAEKRHVDSKNASSSSDGRGPFIVPASLFKTILYGWCCLSSKGQIAQVRMREILDLLIHVVRHDEEILKKQNGGHNNNNASWNNIGHHQPLGLTTDLFNTYLMGLRSASKVSRNAANYGVAVLDEMNRLHDQFGWHTKPSTKSYSFVIEALANRGYDDAGSRAEKVLRKLQKAHEDEKEAYWKEYGEPYNTQDPSSNKRRIPTADAVVYNGVITAYNRGYSSVGAKKAKDLLIEMMTIKDGTVQPDFAHFTGVIAAFAKVAGNKRISNVDRFKAAQEAEEVLNVMLQDYKQAGKTLTPDGKTSRSNKKISMVGPYNACMHGYANSGSPEAALRAESILQKLLLDFTSGQSDFVPDKVSFNTVLSTWSSVAGVVPEAPQKAEELLHLQMELIESGVLDKCAKADCRSFAAVMAAYARSRDPQKVHHAYRLLLELQKCIAEGTVTKGTSMDLAVAFTMVLNAAAHADPASTTTRDEANVTNSSSGAAATTTTTTPSSSDSGFLGAPISETDDVYTIALQTYRELKEDVYRIGCKPDHVAFGAMLEVIGVHTHASSVERRQMVQVVFEDACAAGHVSKLVLKPLFRHCPDKEMLASLLRSHELANGGIDNVDELPRSWTRNVTYKYRSMKRSAKSGSYSHVTKH